MGTRVQGNLYLEMGPNSKKNYFLDKLFINPVCTISQNSQTKNSVHQLYKLIDIMLIAKYLSKIFF